MINMIDFLIILTAGGGESKGGPPVTLIGSLL